MPNLPMTKSAAQGLLNQYAPQIEAASEQNIINNIIGRLEAQANEIEKIARRAYLTLGCKDGTLEAMEAELNDRLIKLQNETFNLNGAALQENLLKDLYNSTAFSFDRQQDYNNFLRYIEQQVNTSVQNKLPKIAELAANELLGLSGSLTLSTQGKTKGMLRNTKGQFVTKFSEVFNELGSKLTEKFDSYFSEHFQDIQKTLSISTSSTYNGFNIDLQWEELPVESFLQMTNYNNKKERDRFFKAHPDLKGKILNKYKEKIIASCPNISRKDLFNEALDTVMFAQVNNKDLDSFFGMTGANLIGRLGEVQALYYIKVLTNNNSNNFPGIGDWIGGKGNPHADELLSGLLGQFGIQVKNTTLEGSDFQVDFQGFNIKTADKKKVDVVAMDGRKIPSLLQYTHTTNAVLALQAASGELFGANGVLPGQFNLIEAFETILGMHTFNIEYLWHTDGTKPKYYAHSNPEFSDVRAQIESLASQANKIMSLMAAAVMYMQTGPISGGNSNTVYLIGGSTIISAASILRQIASEVKSGIDYLNSSFKISAGGSTIVEALNSEKRVSLMNFALQSSYTFIKR